MVVALEIARSAGASGISAWSMNFPKLVRCHFAGQPPVSSLNLNNLARSNSRNAPCSYCTVRTSSVKYSLEAVQQAAMDCNETDKLTGQIDHAASQLPDNDLQYSQETRWLGN